MPVKPNDQGQDNTPVQTPQEAPAEAVQTPQASDTTVPGGRYKLPDGTLVNANGEPIKE